MMIPILSSILISLPADASLIEERSTTDENRSSLILAEDRVDEPQNPPLIIADSSLSPENIPITIEHPIDPNTTAESLGQPITVNEETSNLEQSQSSVNWKKPDRVKETAMGDRILVTKTRQGKIRHFKFEVDSQKFKLVQDDLIIEPIIEEEDNQDLENNTEEEDNQDLENNIEEETINNQIETPLNVVEILADEQEYLDREQIIRAKGNVVIRFANGILIADQVLVNLVDRVAVAQDNVNLQRGEQLLKGDRFEYYFVEDKGVIFNASGEIYQPSLNQDTDFENNNNPIQSQPLTSQLQVNQPLRRVVSEGGYSFVVGSVRELAILEQSGRNRNSTNATGGKINRFRFQAEKVNFDSDGWEAVNIRITNDPFSPPEFEIRADTAYLTKISPLRDELVTTNSRLVFDQGFSIPIFRNRLVFDRRERNPGLFTIGFDGEDLGGLYIEREFDIYSNENFFFSLTPQILLQRAFFPDEDEEDDDGSLLSGSSYGLVSRLEANFSERTNLRAIGNLTGLDFDNIDDRLRATIRLNQKVGDLSAPYNLSLQYNYRDRLFNGSLGFRTVQQSFGAVISSPYIPIGNTRFNIQYQGSIQNVLADTDRVELLEPIRDDNLTNLTRYQAAALISGNFLLWSSEPLPATAEEGLKYTSTPVAPYLRLNTNLTGVASYYSNGDNQPNLTATIGLEGQFGYFSRPFFDYTGFNLSFSQGIIGDESPFLFDRAVDSQVLSAGLTQQLYGPFRAGLQTFYSIDNSEEISTDYFLEYSRRTYNVILRYNPVLEIGSINFQISDFNWDGNSAPFEGGTGITPVVDGIKRDN